MIDIDQNSVVSKTRFILSPNCSMSWFQLKCFFAITVGLALAIAAFFAAQGLWMVIPFSGLEMLLLGSGLYITCKRAHRREVITVDEEQIFVEKGFSKPTEKWRFDRHWVRLQDEVEKGRKATRHITLGSHGTYIEVGKFLSGIEKDQLAFQLKRCIILD